MDKFFENVARIIEAATQSTLGFVALMLLVFAFLSFFFFYKAPVPIRVGIFVFLFLGMVLFSIVITEVEPPIGVSSPTPPPSSITQSPTNPPNQETRDDEIKRFSSGEYAFFTDSDNFNRDQGIKAFNEKDYLKAADFFQKAVENDPSDPEVQIYLNNAKARQTGSPVTLAAIVSVKNYKTNSSQEILRGVADAQTKFNDLGGLNQQLLQIVLANDNDEPTEARKVAQQLADNKNILGVIGHNSSNASKAALPAYEKAQPGGLAMVSSTSTSTWFSKNFSKVFFRTVPSDKETGEKLAVHIKETLRLDKVLIFTDPKINIYSNSLKEAFENHFVELLKDRRAVRTIPIAQNTLNQDFVKVLQRAFKEQVRAALLFTDINSAAVEIAKANASLPQEQRLHLLGGDALYKCKILEDAKKDVEGLILAIPWYANSQNYANEAFDRWNGQVSWFTAKSFDATQALITALSTSDNPDRASVLQELRSINLSPNETSGDRLKFSKSGEPIGQNPSLVHVVEVKGSGSGCSKNSQFSFKLLK